MNSGRWWSTLMALTLAAAVVFPPVEGAAELPPGALTRAEVRQQLLEYSASYALPRYDADSGMLRDDTGALAVRDTMISAFLWAETGRKWRARRAVSAVLDEQQLDPSQPEFGNFPYHPGEASVDRAWSAFIGSYLLVFADRYAAWLPATLVERIDTGAGAAARHRLAVQPGEYGTNTFILTTFILLRAGERLGDEELLAAGRDHWARFEATTDSGGIAEYNSPDYLKVDLYALGFIVDHVAADDIVAAARRIRRLFWWSITNHYHQPTGQLAGPWGRTYTDRMRYEATGVQALLFRESWGLVPLTYDEHVSPPVDATSALQSVLVLLVRRSWPAAWVETALGRAGTGQFRERTKHYGAAGFQQITTFRTSTLAFGSVNKETLSGFMQDQARPLIAHSVRRGHVGVLALRGRFSARTPWVSAVQSGRSALVVVTVGTAGMDPPPSAALRLEAVGAGAEVTAIRGGPGYGNGFTISWMGRPVNVRIAESQLPPEARTTWTWGVDGQRAVVEVDAALDGTAGDSTAVVPLVFGIHVGAPGAEPIALAPVEVDVVDGTLRASWASPSGHLEMAQPDVASTVRVEQWVDGVLVTAAPLDPP